MWALGIYRSINTLTQRFHRDQFSDKNDNAYFVSFSRYMEITRRECLHLCVNKSIVRLTTASKTYCTYTCQLILKLFTFRLCNWIWKNVVANMVQVKENYQIGNSHSIPTLTFCSSCTRSSGAWSMDHFTNSYNQLNKLLTDFIIDIVLEE